MLGSHQSDGEGEAQVSRTDGARGEATRLIHAGRATAAASPVRTVAPTLQRGSTLLLPRSRDLYREDIPTYGMNSLAVHDALKAALGDLEGADHVELFSSGLAACTGAILCVVEAGDEILIVESVYGPTRRFCDRFLTRMGVTTRRFTPKASPDEVAAMIGPRTRLLVLESPGSLTFDMLDVAALARVARARGVLTMMDNTWAAGLIFKPLDHGVDLSVQALTKYVCGHSDVFLGSVAARDRAVALKLANFVRDTGASTSPDDVFQALRGLRTLKPRIERHGQNGLIVARWLQTRREVKRVLHPALPDDPGHGLWARDYAGACGLFGLVLEPASDSAVEAFLDRLKLFGLGFSWGGYESLAIPCDPQLRRTPAAQDLGGPLIRLHVGLEDPQDLINDLEQGFAALAAAPP